MSSKLTALAALLSLTAVQAQLNFRVGHAGAPPAPAITPRVAYADVAADLVRRADPTLTAVGATAAPLTQYHIPYTAIPSKVNPFGPEQSVVRGPQAGYNICNDKTEGPDSMCQTLIVNALDDFCLWGSATPNGEVGSFEAAGIAYCVKKGHGTRVMPPGTIKGAQFLRTSKYIQVTGIFDQTGINLTATDTGGEFDPHGADLQGNPLGGLVYSTGLPSGDKQSYVQAIEWNNFIGGGQFCMKLCDPNQGPDNYCENRYDLVGCQYNMPAAYKEGEFTSCDSDLQDIVGRYVGADGKTSTWKQPEPLTETPPYQPRTPSSSNCQTFSSAQLFGAAATASATGSGASTTSTATGTRTTSSGSSSTASRTSGASSASPSETTNGAARTMGSGVALVALVFGAVVAAL